MVSVLQLAVLAVVFLMLPYIMVHDVLVLLWVVVVVSVGLCFMRCTWCGFWLVW